MLNCHASLAGGKLRACTCAFCRQPHHLIRRSDRPVQACSRFNLPVSSPSADSRHSRPPRNLQPSRKRIAPLRQPTASLLRSTAILQARLAGTPLEDRGIFLTQSPEGGVNVYVGLTRYNGVDEVPDPEVKAAIRAAITEWENKYTPGL